MAAAGGIMPHVEGASVQVAAPGWVAVSFARPFQQLPGVAVSTVAQTAAGPTRAYTAPLILLRAANVAATATGRITLAAWPGVRSITLPRVTVSVAGASASDWDGWMQRYLWPIRLVDDWLALNYVRDRIRLALAGLMAHVWNDFVVPRVNDAVQRAINTLRDDTQNVVADLGNKVSAALDNARSQVQVTLDGYRDNVNTRIGEFRGSVNQALADQRNELQAAFNSLTAYAQASFNDLVPAMLQAMGVPKGSRLVWVPIRNVTTSGFEFYAQGGGTGTAGGTYYWVAASLAGAGRPTFRLGAGGRL